MREILFRGKRKDNDEWIEGSLIITTSVKEKMYIVDSCYCYDGCVDEEGYADFDRLNAFEVNSETVGQYTELTDKNGKKIFEGDILSEKPPMNQTAYIGYVKYDEKSAVWRFMIGNDTKYNGVLLGSYSSSYKVIGNIHDNPELLKGGAVVE